MNLDTGVESHTIQAMFGEFNLRARRLPSNLTPGRLGALRLDQEIIEI